MLQAVEKRVMELMERRKDIETELSTQAEQARVFVQRHNENMQALYKRLSEIDGGLHELGTLLDSLRGAGAPVPPPVSEDAGWLE